MLKKIPVAQLRLGMHLHALEGSWIDHPFWKSRFTLRDPVDLRRLREGAVVECWIDVSKGLDIAAPEPEVRPRPPAPAPAIIVTAPMAPAAPPPPPAPTRSMDEELRQAAAVCNRGREAVESMFREARMGRAVDTEGCLPLVSEITESVIRHPGAMVSLARLKTKDEYSYMHSVAVCALMVSLARHLGMDEAGCREAGVAGLMHDIGKAVIPLDILNKPGKLTDAEFTTVRTHPERGHAMLVEGRGASEAVLDVCLHHHERVDGTGYPRRLSGDALTRIARMGAICDVYDAITSNRPYKMGWDPAESIARMASWKGHFDPTLFQAFVRSLGIYPVGSLVALASGRLAVVMEQNPQSLTSPVVKVFFSTKSQMPIPTQRVDLATSGSGDRIVGRESPAKWGFGFIDELWADPEAIRARRAPA